MLKSNHRLSAIIFSAILLLAQTGFAQEKLIYPSLKHPDFPFSDAVAYKGVLYLSGDLGTDVNGVLVKGGIDSESKQLMQNLEEKLARYELDMSALIKCTVFLADMSEWSAFNDVYAGYFKKGQYPARTAVGASGLALGARVEIECNAALEQ